MHPDCKKGTLTLGNGNEQIFKGGGNPLLIIPFETD